MECDEKHSFFPQMGPSMLDLPHTAVGAKETVHVLLFPLISSVLEQFLNSYTIYKVVLSMDTVGPCMYTYGCTRTY